MYHNIGNFDRLFRVAIGIVLIAYAATNLSIGTLMFVFYLVGFVLIITAMVGWCPCYTMCGYSTRRVGFEKISKEEISSAVRKHKIDHGTSSENKKEVKSTKKSSSKKKSPVEKKSTKSTSKKKTSSTKKKTASKKK